MVRRRNDEDFIDEMPTLEHIFETEEASLSRRASMRSTEVMVAGNLTSQEVIATVQIGSRFTAEDLMSAG